MKIGELAVRAGVACSAIRFYERTGLLPTAERAGNGYRVYGEEALERLRQINMGQALGFSLDTMRSVYASAQGLSKDDLIARLDARLGEIEQLQAALHAQSRELLALRETLCSAWSQGLCASATAITAGASEFQRMARSPARRSA